MLFAHEACVFSPCLSQRAESACLKTHAQFAEMQYLNFFAPKRLSEQNFCIESIHSGLINERVEPPLDILFTSNRSQIY